MSLGPSQTERTQPPRKGGEWRGGEEGVEGRGGGGVEGRGGGSGGEGRGGGGGEEGRRRGGGGSTSNTRQLVVATWLTG